MSDMAKSATVVVACVSVATASDLTDFGAFQRCFGRDPDTLCRIAFDCDDDDVCTWDRCIDGACEFWPITYGDVDHDAAVGIFDVFCILNGFGGNFSEECTEEDCDITGINAGLQLLSWIDRDEVFEEMIQGERHSRTYELGEKRAQLLYQMLAPNDVKVVVSHAGDDAVSVSATDREHDVLTDFLSVLNWMH